jgi:hypothetical protein
MMVSTRRKADKRSLAPNTRRASDTVISPEVELGTLIQCIAACAKAIGDGHRNKLRIDAENDYELQIKDHLENEITLSKNVHPSTKRVKAIELERKAKLVCLYRGIKPLIAFGLWAKDPEPHYQDHLQKLGPPETEVSTYHYDENRCACSFKPLLI